MKEIKLAIFDMAGTTIDDRDEVYRVLREATERAGARYSDEEFQRWMGTEKRYAIENLLRVGGIEPTEDVVEEQWQWFRTELRRTYTENPPTILPGVADALTQLRDNGVTIGITTGFSREIMLLILDAIGWTPREAGGDDSSPIDFATAGDEVSVGRPEPFLIQSIMKKAGISDANLVVSSGDTAADVQSANKAHVTSVGVLTGHLTKEDFEVEGADVVLDGVASFPQWAEI